MSELWSLRRSEGYGACDDEMTVYAKDRIVFRLTCGMEIEVYDLSVTRLALAVGRFPLLQAQF